MKLPKREEKVREYRVPAFKRYFENYDDLSFAFARAADDFDLEIHMIDMVRVGVENFEINFDQTFYKQAEEPDDYLYSCSRLYPYDAMQEEVMLSLPTSLLCNVHKDLED